MGKQVRLNHQQFYLLADGMRTQQEYFLTTNPTLGEAVRFMSEKVGFPVNAEQVSAAAELVGVKWESRSQAKASKRSLVIIELHQHVERLLVDNQKLRARIDVQNGLIHELYKQLGAKFPNGYSPPFTSKVHPISAVSKT